MMEVMSAWGPLIYAGCFAATLSSAIGSLEGAPRVFQALSKDKLLPGLYFFAKGKGANNDPVRGYFLVSTIALICLLIGNLNVVSLLYFILLTFIINIFFSSLILRLRLIIT
jgi:solute carrier family 12 sodium/potassium/chloride transporter 2